MNCPWCRSWTDKAYTSHVTGEKVCIDCWGNELDNLEQETGEPVAQVIGS